MSTAEPTPSARPARSTAGAAEEQGSQLLEVVRGKQHRRDQRRVLQHQIRNPRGDKQCGQVARRTDRGDWACATPGGSAMRRATSSRRTPGRRRSFDHQAAAREEILAVVPPLIPGTTRSSASGARWCMAACITIAPSGVTPDVLADLSNPRALGARFISRITLPRYTPSGRLRRRIPAGRVFPTPLSIAASQSWRRPLPCRGGSPRRGVRRYGFHGLSYEYLATRLPGWAGTGGSGSRHPAHLGNGAVCARTKNGRSVASAMGFTAVDRLMMGTRCGCWTRRHPLHDPGTWHGRRGD